MYSKTTRSIRVTVEPQFLADRSDPAQRRYFWAYTVEIANGGAEPIQVLARHWIITDGNGRREEVRGPGVVGEQPVIGPGESFTYTSGCPLTTASGMMAGTYQAIDAAGEAIEVAIPAFSLDMPASKRVLN
jgi:ApaG protein